MQLRLPLLLSTLLITHQTLAQHLKNTSREFYLKTAVVPGQPSLKNRFANLYVTPYHIGAGFNAAALEASPVSDSKAFLNYTENRVDGTNYHQLVYNVAGYPYYLDMEVNSQPYAAWDPVEINIVKNKPQGFYFNSHNQLEFTTTPLQPPTPNNGLFLGWIVCNWNLGSPLLFFREIDPASGFPAPCSCADVYLVPQYL